MTHMTVSGCSRSCTLPKNCPNQLHLSGHLDHNPMKSWCTSEFQKGRLPKSLNKNPESHTNWSPKSQPFLAQECILGSYVFSPLKRKFRALPRPVAHPPIPPFPHYGHVLHLESQRHTMLSFPHRTRHLTDLRKGHLAA